MVTWLLCSGEERAAYLCVFGFCEKHVELHCYWEADAQLIGLRRKKLKWRSTWPKEKTTATWVGQHSQFHINLLILLIHSLHQLMSLFLLCTCSRGSIQDSSYCFLKVLPSLCTKVEVIYHLYCKFRCGNEPSNQFFYTFKTEVDGKPHYHHSFMFSYPQVCPSLYQTSTISRNIARKRRY